MAILLIPLQISFRRLYMMLVFVQTCRLRRFKDDLDNQCININECFAVADYDKGIIALEKGKRDSF